MHLHGLTILAVALTNLIQSTRPRTRITYGRIPHGSTVPHAHSQFVHCQSDLPRPNNQLDILAPPRTLCNGLDTADLPLIPRLGTIPVAASRDDNASIFPHHLPSLSPFPSIAQTPGNASGLHLARIRIPQLDPCNPGPSDESSFKPYPRLPIYLDGLFR